MAVAGRRIDPEGVEAGGQHVVHRAQPVLVLVALIVGVVTITGRTRKAKEAARKRAELEPVSKLVFEDVTVARRGAARTRRRPAPARPRRRLAADHQRALDAYEDAKQSAEAIRRPEDAKHVTEILDDGRYAIACVRARVDGTPLPTRRPPCFFDPRHGPSVVDVRWAPPGGALREVPACALDSERVLAGAEPHSRQVLVGSARVPYWQAGGPTSRTPSATSAPSRRWSGCSSGCCSAAAGSTPSGGIRGRDR